MNTIRVYENKPLKEWIFECRYNDDSPPSVKIEKPRGYLYIFGKPIIALPNEYTIIIGKITAEVLAEDGQTDIKRVEFYLDGELMATIEEEPYKYVINEQMYGKHELTAVAYNGICNTNSNAITFWAFIW